MTAILSGSIFNELSVCFFYLDTTRTAFAQHCPQRIHSLHTTKLHLRNIHVINWSRWSCNSSALWCRKNAGGLLTNMSCFNLLSSASVAISKSDDDLALSLASDTKCARSCLFLSIKSVGISLVRYIYYSGDVSTDHEIYFRSMEETRGPGKVRKLRKDPDIS